MTGKQKVRNKPASKPAAEKSKGFQARKIVFLFLLLLLGLYFGFAGWTRIYYEALVQRAEEARVDVDCSDPNTGVYAGDELYCTEEDYLAAQQLQLMENAGLYWIFFLPDPGHLISSAFAFGLTGNLVGMLRAALRKKSLPDLSSLSMTSGLGGMTAIMLLGALYLFPTTEIALKPILQPFLCLFAGAYSEHIQKWFQSVINKFFTLEREKT